MREVNHSRGFTIIEIIIVIVLVGIIGGIVAMIIGRSAESYQALSRRDKLQTTARLAVERIAREVRHALPNSICTFNGASCTSPADRLYFIRAIDAGRYQHQAGSYPSGAAKNPLTIAPPGSTRFDVVSGLVNAATGQWIAVYNINNADPYAGTNRRQINATATLDTGDGDISQIQFAAATSFPMHSPQKRFHVIENNATLFYLQGTDLFRADTTLNAPNTLTGSERLLLENVQNLDFVYSPGSQQRAGLLRIELTVSEQGEQIQLVHEVHVYNVP